MRGYRAIIGLGSNLGDRAANLLGALQRLLARDLQIVRCSSIYQTAPVDYLDQPAFLNMVALLDGENLPPPRELLSICLKIEAELGRERLIPKGPRPIDLDLLIYDDLIVEYRSDQRGQSISDRSDLSISDQIDLRSDRSDLRSPQLIDLKKDRPDLRSTDRDRMLTQSTQSDRPDRLPDQLLVRYQIRSTDRSLDRSELISDPISDQFSDCRSDQSDQFDPAEIDLILPHPRLHERGFVLVPLVEVVPDDTHPQLKLSYRELLARLPEQNGVYQYKH